MTKNKINKINKGDFIEGINKIKSKCIYFDKKVGCKLSDDKCSLPCTYYDSIREKAGF